MISCYEWVQVAIKIIADFRYIFITDWAYSNSGLLRFEMDGLNMTSMVNSGLIHPFGLTLDLPTKTVYWLDSYLEYIHSIDYEMQFKRRHVISGYQVPFFRPNTSTLFSHTWAGGMEAGSFKDNAKIFDVLSF